MKHILLLFWFAAVWMGCSPQLGEGLRRKDVEKDVAIITDRGTMIIRLSDSTPLHRNNFVKLVKRHYYDGILFHRVIQHFMIQAGDPNSKGAAVEKALGNGDLGYTIPAEFRPTLFHHKGVIAAAREGDLINPQKASSATQFYIVQGKIFNDAGLDSVETFKSGGRKIPASQRKVYLTIGGTPHLDQNYTVFGAVIQGLAVIDSIAAVPVNPGIGNRPVEDVKIIRARLIKRSD